MSQTISLFRNKILLIGALTGCIVFVLLYGYLEQARAQANNVPTIDSITVATSSGGASISNLNLTESASTTIYIHGQASDIDGCQEIDDVAVSSSWTTVVYRTNVANAQDCIQNSANCYQVVEQNSDLLNCAGEDIDIDYEFDVEIPYYIDATDAGSDPDYSTTDWTAYVNVIDDQGASATSTTAFEINTLNALEIHGTLSYGAGSLGDELPEQTISIENTGNNNALEPLISDANGWTCDYGSMSRTVVHYNTIAEQLYELGTELTSSAVDTTLDIPKSINGASSTLDLFFKLKIPASGVGGVCNSTLTLIAS